MFTPTCTSAMANTSDTTKLRTMPAPTLHVAPPLAMATGVAGASLTANCVLDRVVASTATFTFEQFAPSASQTSTESTSRLSCTMPLRLALLTFSTGRLRVSVNATPGCNSERNVRVTGLRSITTVFQADHAPVCPNGSVARARARNASPSLAPAMAQSQSHAPSVGVGSAQANWLVLASGR